MNIFDALKDIGLAELKKATEVATADRKKGTTTVVKPKKTVIEPQAALSQITKGLGRGVTQTLKAQTVVQKSKTTSSTGRKAPTQWKIPSTHASRVSNKTQAPAPATKIPPVVSSYNRSRHISFIQTAQATRLAKQKAIADATAASTATETTSQTAAETADAQRKSIANPADEGSGHDDASLRAEATAWVQWYRNPVGNEPLIPETWKVTLKSLVDAGYTRIDISVTNREMSYSAGGLTPRTGGEKDAVIVLTESEAEAEESAEIIPPLILSGADIFNIVHQYGDVDEPLRLSNLPALPAGQLQGGVRMLPAGLTGQSIWGAIKKYGAPVVIGAITGWLVDQGVSEEEAAVQAQAMVATAKPTRRRRRRMLTCADREDIMFLKNTLGSGELGKSAISALLSGCNRR